MVYSDIVRYYDGLGYNKRDTKEKNMHVRFAISQCIRDM